jgi:hypothetical protein
MQKVRGDYAAGARRREERHLGISRQRVLLTAAIRQDNFCSYTGTQVITHPMTRQKAALGPQISLVLAGLQATWWQATRDSFLEKLVNMRRWSALCLVPAVCAAAAVCNVRTVKGDEWKPIAPEELKMTGVPEAPGAPAVYLYRQVDRNDMGVQRGRGANEYNYVRIKVFTEEGRDQANVVIPYEKGRTSIANIRARTIQPDGKVAEFDGKVFDQIVEKKKGEKIQAKTFTLPDVHAGSIIEYHFTIDFEDYYIFRSYWLLSESLFTKEAVFTLKPFEEYPWHFQWTWPAGLPKGTDRPKQGSDHIVRMTSHNIPAFEQEDYMPPENELKYRVVFIYRDEPFEQDADKYWKQFGKKKNGQIEGFVDKKKAMAEAVATIVSPNDPPEAKLRKIYDRVQQIPNSSYLPRKSEEQMKRENIKPNKDVEDLWKHQYGSGSDLTWLFMGLARAAGFEASPCLVSGRSEYFFRKERANSEELDANVVLVKVNGKDEYFDPGAAFTPYGFLPWMETGVTGLKLDGNGGTWIETGLPTAKESRVTRTSQLRLTKEGDLTGTLRITYTGLEASGRRRREHNHDETERKKVFEDAVKNDIPAGSEIEMIGTPDWTNSETPLVIDFNVKIPGWLASAGRRGLMATGIFNASEKHLFEHANRTWPIYFAYPFSTLDEISIELPDGWKVETLPQDMTRDAKAVVYKRTVQNQNGVLKIQRELDSELVVVAKENYSILRNFYQLVKTQDEQQVVLQPAGTSASK